MSAILEHMLEKIKSFSTSLTKTEFPLENYPLRYLTDTIVIQLIDYKIIIRNLKTNKDMSLVDLIDVKRPQESFDILIKTKEYLKDIKTEIDNLDKLTNPKQA